jgi:predicted amidohydrolase
MDCKIKDKEYNLGKCLGWLEDMKGKADIVCFPELFTTGYRPDLLKEALYTLAETVPGATTDTLCKKAQDCRLTIVGNIVEKHPVNAGVLYNTAFIIDREGNLRVRYRKFHLYPTESLYFRAGNRFPVVSLGQTTIGVAICYDHAFPELFRLLTLKGAEIIFIPSAIPTGYEYLLNLRTRARAQDNQIFVATANRVGKEGNILYCGLSKVADPKGEVIAEASFDKEQILYTQINLHLILAERKQEPILKSLRPEIYKYLPLFI